MSPDDELSVAAGPVPVAAGTNRRTPLPASLSLDVLSRRVRAARVAVHELRDGPANRPHMASARRCLLVVLEEYVTALESRKLPVPHALRRELQLHRDLFDE